MILVHRAVRIWKTKTVRLGRPYLSRGVPYNFRRYDLPFLHRLARTGKEVDVLSQSDLESAPSSRVLATVYDLIVFPGHHEYVTTHEYDLVEGYRNLGANSCSSPRTTSSGAS